MKHRFGILILFGMAVMSFVVGANYANAIGSLDELLQRVKGDQEILNQENAKREQTFREKRDDQKKLLSDAQRELRQEEEVTHKLTQEFEKQEKELQQHQEKLDLAIGTLGEMFGVVRQVAGDFQSEITNSVISAEIKDRSEFLQKLADAKALPNSKDLEHLWFLLQEEMTESGKTVQFTSKVIKMSGEQKEQKIIRVGAFNLISEGLYLSYHGDTGQTVELARQPEGQFLNLAEELAEQVETDHLKSFGVDPSRGSILALLVETPTLWEKIEQGGLIGYVIMVLLALGLALVAERYIVLKRESDQILRQLTSETISETNPLGELISVFRKSQDDDLESLELKLDEVILKKVPELNRGISTIKLLSGVAPLLGLLGTVTGMIVTFQSITLFGTGDPKIMAGGISQALVTTVLGLVCAIPLLLLHNFIQGKSKRIIQILEEQSAGLIAERVCTGSGQ